MRESRRRERDGLPLRVSLFFREPTGYTIAHAGIGSTVIGRYNKANASLLPAPIRALPNSIPALGLLCRNALFAPHIAGSSHQTTTITTVIRFDFVHQDNAGQERQYSAYIGREKERVVTATEYFIGRVHQLRWMHQKQVVVVIVKRIIVRNSSRCCCCHRRAVS